MFIVCPKCFTKYLISDEIKVLETQKCHCSACGHYFEQKAMKEVEVKKAPSLADEQKQEILKENAENEALTKLNESLPTALFTEPLNRDEKSEKKEDDLLSVVPEEFKPVENKKSSLFGTLLWLSIGAGICFFAYLQKDYLIDSIDTVILSQLDKTKVKKEAKKDPFWVEKKVEIPVQMPEEKFLPIETQEVVLTPAEQLPVVDVVEPVVGENEVQDVKSCLSSLVVQNVGYEIGLNEVGVERLLIRGAVVNTSLKACPLLETKAVIYDDEDNIVARKRVVFNEKTVNGNAEILFETAVVPSPKSVSKIEVVFDE